DLQRLSRVDDLVQTFFEKAGRRFAQELDESAELYTPVAERLITLGSLLPIGHTNAKFFINVDRALSTSYLATQMRTTEAHFSDGNPSMNGLWFPIDHSGGEQIAASYRRLGNPRLQVTRVIDLTGLSIREVRLGGVHLLAYRYGDWFDIRGASQTVNVLLDRDDDHRAHIREFVHDRLYPNPLIRAEIDVIARGVRGAARTRDWIAKSQSWSV